MINKELNRKPVEDEEITRPRDWELAQLPSLFIRISPDGETATHEKLREAIANRERISSDVAARVIQSAVDDGIIDRENSEVLRLNEGVNDHLEDFPHDE